MSADVCTDAHTRQHAPAAVTLAPELLERAAPLHAALVDVEQQLERVRP